MLGKDGEAGKETSAEKVQGKRGREINNKAGGKSYRKVCYFAGRTGTVEILIVFLRETDRLTDRDRPTYTDSYDTSTCTCCTCSTWNRLWVALLFRLFETYYT